MPINNNTTQDITNISWLEQVLESNTKKSLQTLSTLDTTNKAQDVSGLYSTDSAGDVIALTPPTKGSDTNYMDALVAGLNSYVEIQTNALIMQNEEFVNLQQLDQTMADAVLISTNLTIQETKKQMEFAIQLGEQSAVSSQIQRWVSIVSFVVVAAIIAATVVATVVTGGAASPLLAGEIAGETSLAGGSAAADTAAATMEAAMDQITVDAFGQSVEMGSGEVTELSDLSTVSSNEATISNVESAETTTTKTTSSRLTKIAQSLKSKSGKLATSLSISAVSAAPLFVTSWAKSEIATAKTQEAQMQQQVGASTGTLTMFNGFLDFYQQSLQQMTSTVQETAKDYSSTISSIAAIFSGIDQISVALQQAV